MLDYVNKMYARRTRFFLEQFCDPVTVLVCINLTLPQRISCSIHRRVFEIVVHQMDAIIDMMYLGPDNSSINCKGTDNGKGNVNVNYY